MEERKQNKHTYRINSKLTEAYTLHNVSLVEYYAQNVVQLYKMHVLILWQHKMKLTLHKIMINNST